MGHEKCFTMLKLASLEACPCIVVAWVAVVAYFLIVLIASGFYNSYETKLVNGDLTFSGIDFKCGEIIETTEGFECQYAFVRFSSKILQYFDSSIRNYKFYDGKSLNSTNRNTSRVHNTFGDYIDEWLLIEWDSRWSWNPIIIQYIYYTIILFFNIDYP